MGLPVLKIPTSSGVIPESLLENKYPFNVFNEETKKYEETEKVSTISKYRGGNIFGYTMRSKGAAEVIFYDNSEKAEGNTIFGAITFKEKETRDKSFPYPIKFKEGIYTKIVSGELEPNGVIYADVE